MSRSALFFLAALTATAPALAAGAPAAGGLSKLPKQIVSVEAAYPPDAAAAGLEADVVLNLTIDTTGHVTHAEVATSAGAGREAFDAAAVAAATGYLFTPAESDGKPVAVELAYKVKFRLHARTPASAASAPTVPTPPTSTTSSATVPRPPRESLAGLLRERGTRTPLIGFVVTVSKQGASPPEAYEATSDGNGRFVFFDLAPGAWDVDVEPPAYLPFRTHEEIRAGEKTVVTYYVERGQANPLDETVTAARAKKDVSHVVLSAEVIDRVPGTAGDPLAVVQNLAGVARAPAGSGLLIVRGSAPEDTQIFVDGMDVPLVYHFGGLRSVLPERVIESIEFVPGNYSPEYGRATAGIVDVHLKELKPPRFGGSIDISVLDTGVYLEAPLGSRGGVAIAARRSYLDAILSAVVPSDASIGLVTAPVYYDGQLLANYRLTPAHDLRAMVFGADDRLALLFKNPADFSQQATGNRLSARTGFWRALAADHYTPRAGTRKHASSIGGTGRRDDQRRRSGAGPSQARRPAARHPAPANRALGHAGGRHRRADRKLQRTRAAAGASQRGPTDGQSGPESDEGDDRPLGMEVVAGRVRRDRAAPDEAAADRRRAAGRLFRDHPPGRAGAAPVRARRAVAALGAEGGAGHLRPAARRRGDRPRLRQPGPEGRARRSRRAGGRMEGLARDHPGRDRVLQAPLEPGQPDGRHPRRKRRGRARSTTTTAAAAA